MTNYIAIDKGFNTIKRRNFFIHITLTDFVYMCFHFTIVFFFMIQLNSVMFVGLFLGFGNFISFLVDSPIGVLQKYFKQKNLFICGSGMMLISSLIFLYFIFQGENIDVSKVDGISEFIKWFLTSWFNIGLLVLSVIFYGIIKELNEVTNISYITNNSDPSQYADLFSKKSIFTGVGMLFGLISSGIFLAWYPILAVGTLVCLVLCYMMFIIVYFDNSEHSLDEVIMQKIKLLTKREKLNEEMVRKTAKKYQTEIVNNKQDLFEKTKNLKVIFLKPIELKNSIDWGEMFGDTIKDMKIFFKIMFSKPWSYKLLVITGIFVFFGMWDNFVTTFLLDYIDDIMSTSKEVAKFDKFNLLTAYVVIAIFCIPSYGLQVPFVKFAEKWGSWKIMMPGLLFAGISMFIFGLSKDLGFNFVLLAGLLNGIGYAACSPTSQGEFTNEYNQIYADKNNLKQIDANASSAPNKMLANIANVIGLGAGGVFLQIFQYTVSFFLLGFLLLGLLVISMIKRKEWKLY